jgi:hypothetical protein
MDQLKNLVNAFAFAESNFLPLNGGLVVIWRHCPFYNQSNWSELQTTSFSHLAKFLQRQSIIATFVWTRERATGHGAHTHILLHLGETPMAVCRTLRDELMRKFKFAPSGLHISMGDFGMRTSQMRAGHLRYLLKGFDHGISRYTGIGAETEKLADVLGIQDRGSQGIIEMKRCGTSQNIGIAARRAAGWREVNDLTGLHRILYPGNVPDSCHGDILS